MSTPAGDPTRRSEGRSEAGATGLFLKDIVLTLGRGRGERVLLRGADLALAPGECVLISGLDHDGRRAVSGLLRGRRRPRYGEVAVGRGSRATGSTPEVRVLAVGMRGPSLAAQAPEMATVVLAGEPPRGATCDRHFVVRGGRFVDQAVVPARHPGSGDA